VRKKNINSKYTLFETSHYPLKNMQISPKKRLKHKAVLGIGGNIGDVLRRFERLYWFFKRSKYVNIIQTSPILKNPPFGLLEQDDFYNSILIISTTLTPRELLHYLLRVEKKFGRKRTIPNGARTLDIDIIFYDDISISSKELTIPHQDWMNRDSVLIPLSLIKAKT
jgi:2-amino-4-hydroxy-6-hydroxymethyldihydropteridine diphosphokinase